MRRDPSQQADEYTKSAIVIEKQLLYVAQWPSYNNYDIFYGIFSLAHCSPTNRRDTNMLRDIIKHERVPFVRCIASYV